MDAVVLGMCGVWAPLVLGFKSTAEGGVRPERPRRENLAIPCRLCFAGPKPPAGTRPPRSHLPHVERGRARQWDGIRAAGHVQA